MVLVVLVSVNVLSGFSPQYLRRRRTISDTSALLFNLYLFLFIHTNMVSLLSIEHHIVFTTILIVFLPRFSHQELFERHLHHLPLRDLKDRQRRS